MLREERCSCRFKLSLEVCKYTCELQYINWEITTHQEMFGKAYFRCKYCNKIREFNIYLDPEGNIRELIYFHPQGWR